MPGYRTQQQNVAVLGSADLVIRSLLDRNQYADPIGEAARLGISSAAWPLFGMLWPSSHQLAARLAARALRPGERILEIGCGLALASLVAHRRGADVTASDCHPLAERFLRQNLHLNGLLPLPYRHGHWGGAASALARWDDASAAICVVTGRYDLIVGSDLLYEPDGRGALAGFIDAHAMPAGQVWIMDPDRGNRAAFHRAMAGHGFARIEQKCATTATAQAAAYKGRLLMYERR